MTTHFSSDSLRSTIGLAVGQACVRGVLLWRGRRVWAMMVDRDEESLRATIERLLSEAPVAGVLRARVVAAVGPSFAQTKPLLNLPILPRDVRLDDLVRESAPRFFLRNGIPLVTAISRSPDGVVWGAAFDRDVVDGIAAACLARRLRLDAIVPSVAVLGRAIKDGRVIWVDDSTTCEVSLQNGALIAVRRFVTGNGDIPEASAPELLLHSWADDAWRFADALGAATSSTSGVPAWRLPRALGRHVRPWRLVVSVLATVVAGLAWLTAPGVRAALAQRDAERVLLAMANVRDSALAAEQDLNRISNALAYGATFDVAAIPATLLLADLTRAFPDNSAVVSLRLSEDGGTVILLASRAAAVVEAIERVSGVEKAEILGPVTREGVGAHSLERVAVRFRFIPGATRHFADSP